MPYRHQQFVNSEIYHVVTRGIDENLIFKDVDDYYRGIFSIYEFNNIKPVEIKERRKQRKKEKTSGDPFSDTREKLVEILAFCFMPNHIHLLLRQLKDNGITRFMRKLGAGYAGYFNRKYGRKGYVFQNRFLPVHIKNDNQLKIVLTYIHINPVSIIKPKWKEIGIRNIEETIKFVENYKWSSYSDYINKKNFPSVTERKFISEVIGDEQGCRDFIKNWLEYKKEIRKFPELFLE